MEVKAAQAQGKELQVKEELVKKEEFSESELQ
jgi:hypothetical protein